MSDPIAVALIGLGGSALGSLIGVLTSSKLTQYRLEQLEKKVEAHNKLVDRTYKLEAHAQLEDEKLDEIGHKLEELEGYHR